MRTNNAFRLIFVMPLVLFIAAMFSLVAQGPGPLYAAGEKYEYTGKFNEGETVYIFGDSVNVRSAPKTGGDNVIAKLGAGDLVKIVGVGPEFAINGYRQDWLKVEFGSGGNKRTGFVWGGFVALGAMRLGGKSADKMALFGVLSYAEKTLFKGELRIASGGKVLSSAAFAPHAQGGEGKDCNYNYYVLMSESGARGLEEFGGLVTVECSYEACGCPRGKSYFGLAADGVKYVTQDELCSDPGAFVSEKKVIFPADEGGVKNRIVMTELLQEYEEAKKDLVTKKDTKKTFKWSGGELVAAE